MSVPETSSHPTGLAFGAGFASCALTAALVSLATGFSMLVWATAQRDASAVAEGRFLAVVASAVLLAVLPILSLFTAPPGRQFSQGLIVLGFPVLCLAAAVLAPSGPDRGAALGLILAIAIAFASSSLAQRAGSASERSDTSLLAEEISLFALIAFASQTLLRPDEWLALLGQPDLTAATLLRTGLQLFLWPVLFGCILGFLGHIKGRARALFLLVAVVLCVGKISLTTIALALVLTIAAGYGRLPTFLSGLPAFSLFGGSCVILFLQSGFLAALALLACLGVVAAPRPDRTGSETGAPRDADPSKPTPRFWPAVLLVMAGVLVQLGGSIDGTLVQSAGAVLKMLAPLLLVELLLSRRRSAGLDRWAVLVAVLLAIVASRLLNGPDAILVPALCLAIGTTTSSARTASDRTTSNRAGLGAGGILIAALLVFGLGASGYPWLRALPAAELPGLVASVVASIEERSAIHTLIDWPAVTLDATSRAVEFPCPEPDIPPTYLVLDATLANGADLEPGSVVATVRLREGSGESPPVALRAGHDIAEWSARRPDFGDRMAPDPWLAWTSASGDFFGQRYRNRIDLSFDGFDRSAQSTMQPNTMAGDCSIAIRRSEQLPREVVLTLFHLSVGRSPRS